MGRLKDAIIYVSGPMEMVEDAGVGWRREFRDLVNKSELCLNIIDPTQKPGDSPEEICENKNYQIKLQEEGKYEELRNYVHDYRRKDLRFVDLSDALVAVIDRDVYQCGTLNEVFEAERQHKPILTICKGGLARLPRWMFDVVDFDLIFEDVPAVVNKLIEIDNQENELDDRWVLIRQYLNDKPTAGPGEIIVKANDIHDILHTLINQSKIFDSLLKIRDSQNSPFAWIIDKLRKIFLH